jgi:predicted dehydrogenase
MKTKAFSQTFPLTRRKFLCASSLVLGGVSMSGSLLVSAEPQNQSTRKFRAAVIGHTGRGDYGHGLDVIFNEHDNIQIVALADPNGAGRANAAQKCSALRQYDDYRILLEKEKPNLVSIAPRWTDQHHAMAMAALQAGAHIFMEKPIMPTLVEADEALATADRAGLKITVAHQMRLAPGIVLLKNAIQEGLLGDLLQMRAWGKQDSRAGGEDMLVLGTHLFDLMRLFAGDPLWCAARVTQNGRDITRMDARVPTENIGPVAGDEIEAQFAFARGVNATFTSRGKLRERIGHWGIELVGTKTSARILADISPAVYVQKTGSWEANGRNDQWQRWEKDPGAMATAGERSLVAANRGLLDDWLEAIEKNREPACSGRNATKALEMVMAVYHAALSGARVGLPLVERKHPLA